MRVTTVRTINLTAVAAVELAPTNQHRVRLEISNGLVLAGGGAAAVFATFGDFVSPDLANLTGDGAGYAVSGYNSPLVIDIDTHGELVKRSWHVIPGSSFISHLIFVAETVDDTLT